MHASASTVIDRPIDVVFATLADLGTLTRWMTRFESVDAPSDAPAQLGGIFGSAVSHGRRTDWVQHQITVFDPPNRLAFKTLDSAPGAKTHVECIGLGGTTQVHLFTDTEPTGFQARLAEALLGPVQELRLERQLQHELAALKTLVEAHPAAVPAFSFSLARVAA